jgi:hypothetical protein
MGKFESKNLTARFISGNPGLSWMGGKISLSGEWESWLIVYSD